MITHYNSPPSSASRESRCRCRLCCRPPPCHWAMQWKVRLPGCFRRRLQLLFCASFIIMPPVVQRHLHPISTSSRASAVTPPPLIASLSFGWLLHFLAPLPCSLLTPPPSALASAINRPSTFHHAPLVWLVVALPGNPALSSRHRPVPPFVTPLSFGWFDCLAHRPLLPQNGSRASPNIVVSVVVTAHVRR